MIYGFDTFLLTNFVNLQLPFVFYLKCPVKIIFSITDILPMLIGYLLIQVILSVAAILCGSMKRYRIHFKQLASLSFFFVNRRIESSSTTAYDLQNVYHKRTATSSWLISFNDCVREVCK